MSTTTGASNVERFTCTRVYTSHRPLSRLARPNGMNLDDRSELWTFDSIGLDRRCSLTQSNS